MNLLHKLLPLIEPSKAVKHPLLFPPLPPGPPVCMYPPQIYGLAGLGNVLYGFAGRWWGGTALTLAYQWQADGVDLPGETGPFYSYMVPDEFVDITLKITATDQNNQSTVSISSPMTYESLVQLADAQALHTAVNITALGLGTVDGVADAPTVDFSTQVISRMTPKYFTVNGPQSMSFALTTAFNTMRVDYVARMESDLCGLTWNSVDTKDHVSLAYSTNKDYRNMVWQFDIAVSDTAPLINDPARSLTMTVTGRDAGGSPVTYFVALKNYATAPASRSSHISIDFNTVKAGFNADQTMYVGDVDSIFISCITNNYNGSSTNPIAGGPVTAWMSITNNITSGTNAVVNCGVGNIYAHSLAMCTSYDDMYDVSPERVISNIYQLGYRNWINHYCGVSTYPERTWDNGSARLVVNNPGSANGLVNSAAKAWHTSFLQQAWSKGFAVIQSVSFEQYSVNANLSWCQRDYNGNLGATAYATPTYLLSPGNATAMSYLQGVFLEFAVNASIAGVPIYMQVGEPWWWTNPGTNKPCFYDSATTAAFAAAYPGLTAPDMGTVGVASTGTPYDQWMSFLQTTLGKAVSGIRTYVQRSLPSAQFSVLPFLPTIIGNGYMEQVNLPVAYYKAPNFDFFQTEAYDWIIDNDQTDLPTAMTYPLNTLGYPPHKVQYLAGFATTTPTLPADTIEQIWVRIFQNTLANASYGIAQQYIWAYPQVMRDSITYKEGDPTSKSFSFGNSYHQLAT
jgi:hypothetical protein